jgi:poly(A) polymerase
MRSGLTKGNLCSPSGPLIYVLEEVDRFFAEENAQAYLVGGFVRDLIIGRGSKDVDLVVHGDVMHLGRRLADRLSGRFVALNEPHQLARVVVQRDTEAWHLDLSPLSDSIERDIKRRDFTIDALALPVSSWSDPLSIVDVCGGRADIESRLVRAVDEDIFRADPLRMLRALRLVAELDFKLEDCTAELILRHAHMLPGAAAERINEELCRSLATPRSSDALRRMNELGLLLALIPELTPAKDTTQPKEHYWKVLDHSLETVAAVEAMLSAKPTAPEWMEPGIADALRGDDMLMAWTAEPVGGGLRKLDVIKLAALLHDIAKPSCKTVEASGRMRFIGHGEKGSELAESVLQRLRFSRNVVNLVVKMVKHHLRPGQLSRMGVPTRRAMYRYFRDTGEVGVDTILLNLADHLASRGPTLDRDEWLRHAGTARYMMKWYFDEQSREDSPKTMIDGHDIMRELGLAPGPEVGRLLNKVQEAQAAGEVSTREEALEYLRRQL